MSHGDQAAELAPEGSAAPVDAVGEVRGSLTIQDQAIRQIAVAAAREITGRTSRRSGWERRGGRDLPNARVKAVGRHVRIGLGVPAATDRPLSELAGSVRRRVAERVAELTGLTVGTVDVRVARLRPGIVQPDTAAAVQPAGTADPATPVGFGKPAELPMLPAARRPTSAGMIRRLGVVLASVALAIGLAAVYDALAWWDRIDGPVLHAELLDWLDGMAPQRWMFPVGGVVALVGLFMVIIGLLPRPHRAYQATSETGVFVSRRVVEARATEIASRHSGVIDLSVRAHRAEVVVRLRTEGEADVEGEVGAWLDEHLGRLARPPVLRVVAKSRGGRR